MEGYLTEIRLFGPTWSPRNWASCSGQTMPISSFNAVFSLIGTIYGGDGRTTFLLPDLRGRTAVGSGAGIALTPRSSGQKGGAETVTLSTSEMPAHDHDANTSTPTVASATIEVKSSPAATSPLAAGNLFAPPANNIPRYGTAVGPNMSSSMASITSLTFNPLTTILSNNGSSQSHYNMQPWQSCLYIICLSGIYPSRN